MSVISQLVFAYQDEVGGEYAVFDYQEYAGCDTKHVICQRNAEGWQALGSGMGGSVSALAVYDGELYAGGEFAIAGGYEANNIAKWNGKRWAPLSSGFDRASEEDSPYVSSYALAIYKGELIACGSFDTAGGIQANFIAKWDGNTWSPLGSGMNGRVFVLTVHNGYLVVGGHFTTAGKAVASNIAKWNGTKWSSFGLGMNGWVNGLTVLDGELFASGDFTAAGRVKVSHVAKWDGKRWVSAV